MQRVLRGVMSVRGRSEEDLATLSRRRGEARIGERLDGDVQSELTPRGEGKVRRIVGTMIATSRVKCRV